MSPSASRSSLLPALIAWTLALLLVPSPSWGEPVSYGHEETAGSWASLFRSQLDARLSPSFGEDRELEKRITRVWDALVGRVAQRGEKGFDPLQQYPVLGFVDDQFYVMKYRAQGGGDSFVVRAEAEGFQEVPTLGSTLRSFLHGVYQALTEIALEQAMKMASGEGYNPDFDELMAQNPFQHGEAIAVPDMGSFQNRLLRFTGLGGRLGARETETYERMKRQVEPGHSLQVGRAHRWGLAVEIAELVRDGEKVCLYRTVREVAAVRDQFVGEGRVGALLRQPRLGPVLEVSACVERCEHPESWHRLYPDREDHEPRDHGRQARRPSSAEMPPAETGRSSRGSGRPPF